MIHILAIAIYALLQRVFIDNPMALRIRQASSTNEANRLRHMLKTRRRGFFWSLAIPYVIVFFVWCTGYSVDPVSIVNGIGSLIVAYIIVVRQNLIKGKKYESLMGNISTWDKTNYLSEHKRYALFLRGFANDDYSKAEVLSKQCGSERFSEHLFMRILSPSIPVCAVGMTKESDSPIGAVRVYVDDETWKQDVRELMESAEKLYILVEDRSSCVWEIVQSADMLDKTIFLSDDRAKYDRTRALEFAEYGQSVLPEIPLSINANHIAISTALGDTKFTPYENTAEGYSALLGLDVPEDLDSDKIEKIKKRQRGCLYALLIFFGIFFVFGLMIALK